MKIKDLALIPSVVLGFASKKLSVQVKQAIIRLQNPEQTCQNESKSFRIGQEKRSDQTCKIMQVHVTHVMKCCLRIV